MNYNHLESKKSIRIFRSYWNINRDKFSNTNGANNPSKKSLTLLLYFVDGPTGYIDYEIIALKCKEESSSSSCSSSGISGSGDYRTCAYYQADS
ncbi:17286_t:CDS:2 [Gigaspora rosea]|nr:17286_t:CDS:2 [Gigaspora rosea]